MRRDVEKRFETTFSRQGLILRIGGAGMKRFASHQCKNLCADLLEPAT
jgi:hypothetical protein